VTGNGRKLRWLLGVPLFCVIALGVAFWKRPVTFFDKFTELHMLLSGAQSRMITVEGHRMHYYVMGPAAGQAVVLVHGLGGRAEDWENLAPYLTRAGYRVYLPDLFGYGQSARPSRFSYSIPDEAAAVEDFFDVMGLKRVDLGGWSMGGWIVQRVAADYPERIRKLMLFDSAGIYERPKWDTNLFTPVTPDQLAQLDALLMPHPPKVPPFIARDVLRASGQNAWVIHRALASMLTGRDATDALLPTLKMPVLIVWGALDQVTPLDQGIRMHSLIPQSTLQVIPGCGHLAPRQCTPQIGPKVVDFIRQ